MPYENYSLYTTTADPSGDLSVTDLKIDVTTMAGTVAAWIAHSKGTGHFTDFEHLFLIKFTEASGVGGVIVFWAVTDVNVYTWVDMVAGSKGIGLRCRESTGPVYRFACTDHTIGGDQGDWAKNTDYYCIAKRSGIAMTLKAYTGTWGGTLVDTLTFECGTDAYEYIVAVASQEHATDADTATGYVKYLNLQEIFQVSGVVIFQDPAIV